MCSVLKTRGLRMRRAQILSVGYLLPMLSCMYGVPKPGPSNVRYQANGKVVVSPKPISLHCLCAYHPNPLSVEQNYQVRKKSTLEGTQSSALCTESGLLGSLGCRSPTLRTTAAPLENVLRTCPHSFRSRLGYGSFLVSVFLFFT
ncbi:uncharacterized protein EDB93DRAFT_1131018 [Suillus bovinus]|uniref:uncharacterized protein n=1 Tax=Suillus bovinus TaxID=48563 RepID=UPI001B876D0B|nr:uncharacterized protein EDB93DRAFT_1131018 [Suillus bovinus]KAG2155065.1 hypothetical protein EDB93DRAFT_1131018 [Suillus bovinus]